MIERSLNGDSGGREASKGDRVGAIGAADRPMPVYTPARAPVTYPRGTVWLVIGILAFLFAIFFGWVLFLR